MITHEKRIELREVIRRMSEESLQRQKDKEERLKEIAAVYEKVIASDREEDAQKFFTEHVEMFCEAFFGIQRGGFSTSIPKFRFGNEFVSDFVIISGHGYNRHFLDICLVELEPPTAQIFNKDLSFAKRLNGALAQTDSWINWINNNFTFFIKSLDKDLIERNTIGRLHWRSLAEAYITGGIKFDVVSKIIIGRRNMLVEKAAEKKTELYFQSNRKREIITYDRFQNYLETEIKGLLK